MKLIGLFLLLILFGSSSNTASNESIIFASNRNGNSNIYQMNSDGTNLKQLTFGKTEKWSPRIINKNEISYLEQREKEILRIKLNLKTNKITQISQPENCILDDKNALVSPKGDKLLYECKNNIFISDIDGKNPKNLTKNSNAKNFKPTWFPNGKKIAFTTNRDGNLEVYSMNLKGKKLRNLTNHPSNDEAPDVSPDGKKILFSSNRDGNRNQEIYVLDLKNKKLTNISNSKDWELIARWSNDGKKIFFGSNRDKNWEIYSYDFKTKSTQNITKNSSFDGDPQVFRY